MQILQVSRCQSSSKLMMFSYKTNNLILPQKSKEKRSFTESSARATFQGYEPGVSPNADNSKANFTQNNQTKQAKNKHKVARILKVEFKND